MCGIAGIWNYKGKVSIDEIVTFTDSMKHRGPDGSGYVLLNNQHVALGHRRLSILDLSESGAQPMHLLENRYTIAYNGEIFNFIEIRRELQGCGYNFRTDTDTEVFVLAYHHWGKDCFSRFNGMWAAAIWDNNTGELLLSRDRFGIKPLYFLERNGYIAFASETNAFLHLNGYSRTMHDSLFLMNIADPYALEGASLTPFRDIVSLPPGFLLKMDKSGRRTKERWFHPEKHITHPGNNLAENAEHFKSLLLDAISLRLRADVPIATALSGGLDSSSVFSSVVHLSGTNALERTPSDFRRAFIASFPGTELDETEYAREVLRHTGGDGTIVEVNYEGLAGKTEHLTRAFDCIAIHPLTSIHSVYEHMSKAGFRISLDGHGADEQMFGYRDMVGALLNWQKWNGKEKQTRSTFGVLSGLYAPELRKELEEKFNTELEWALNRRKSILSTIGKLTKKPKGYLEDFSNHPLAVVSARYSWPVSKERGYPWVPMPDQIPWLEFFKITMPALLRNYDKASMLNGVEIRMPFMDWRLAMYTMSLPLEHRVGKGFTKLVLREAMRGILAESVRTRTWKVGFTSPVQQWFNGALNEWVMDTIHSASFHNRPWWDSGKVVDFAGKEQKNGWTRIGAEQVWRVINAHLIAH